MLQQYFDVKPEDTHIHDLLGKIAYFKSVITTNYDRLIEDGFGERATVIVNNQQVFGTKRGYSGRLDHAVPCALEHRVV